MVCVKYKISVLNQPYVYHVILLMNVMILPGKSFMEKIKQSMQTITEYSFRTISDVDKKTNEYQVNKY